MKEYHVIIEFDDVVSAEIDARARADLVSPQLLLARWLTDHVLGYARHLPPRAEYTTLEAEESKRHPRITIKARDRDAIYERDGGKCRHCEGSIRFEELFHIDHLVPLSKGGSNDLTNLVLSCVRCNLEKHNKMPGGE